MRISAPTSLGGRRAAGFRKRALALSGFAVVSALVLAGCGSSDSNADAGSGSDSGAGEITVYNAQHESLTQKWADEFTAETGIKVNLRNGGDSEMAAQIIAEGAKSPADVFLTENSPAMAQVENAGLFAPVEQATIDQVPEQFRPSTGNWTGIAARTTVFAYNKDKLTEDQLPKSIMDLQDPSWAGRWGASPSGADFQAIVSAILELKGTDATKAWLDGMKANAKPYQGNSAVMKGVNAGEIDGGVIYQYYWFGDQAKTGENSKNVALHYFKNEDPGAFVSISGGGVLKSSKNQDQAQEFLKFVTGKKGQEVVQTSSFEYPVGSGVAANPQLVPLDELQYPAIDPAKLNGPEVVSLMTAAGLI